MMHESDSPALCRDLPFTKIFAGFFSAVLGAAVVLALMILLLPDKVFFALSNYLQILTAIAAAGVFLYIWHRCGKREIHLYIASAFGLWGIANIFWYVNLVLGLRNEAFPSLIDMGMIASIFLLSVAFQKGLPQKPIAPPIFLGILAICLLIPAGVIVMTGLSASSLVTLLYFFACGSLVVIGLNHSLREYPKILIGTLLFALTFMIYPLREMFFIANPFLPVIGTFVSAGFALITLGMLAMGTQE